MVASHRYAKCSETLQHANYLDKISFKISLYPVTQQGYKYYD